MAKDKRRAFVLCAAAALLLLLLFLLPAGGRFGAAALTCLFAIATFALVKKRGLLSIAKRQMLLVLSAFGVLYVMLYYLSGLAFGFGRSLAFGWTSVWEYVVPIVTIIVSTEYARSVFLAQNSRAADILCYGICVLAEVFAFGDIYRLYTFSLIMDFLGLVVFPALVGNLVYAYLSRRYGMWPNVAYRLLSSLYLYLFRYVPNPPTALLAFFNLFFPLIVFWFADTFFEKKKRRATGQKRRLAYLFYLIPISLIASVALLISCKFRFGLLVIATDSMTGEINRGDAVIYEQYEKAGPIEVGQIILFEKNGTLIVHRVVQIQTVDRQNLYITKGDANEDRDAGFVSEADIVGVCRTKVPFIGYPTLWMRDMISP